MVQRLSRARYPTVQSDNAERNDADIDCIIDTIDSILYISNISICGLLVYKAMEALLTLTACNVNMTWPITRYVRNIPFKSFGQLC